MGDHDHDRYSFITVFGGITSACVLTKEKMNLMIVPDNMWSNIGRNLVCSGFRGIFVGNTAVRRGTWHETLHMACQVSSVDDSLYDLLHLGQRMDKTTSAIL